MQELMLGIWQSSNHQHWPFKIIALQVLKIEFLAAKFSIFPFQCHFTRIFQAHRYLVEEMKKIIDFLFQRVYGCFPSPSLLVFLALEQEAPVRSWFYRYTGYKSRRRRKRRRAFGFQIYESDRFWHCDSVFVTAVTSFATSQLRLM